MIQRVERLRVELEPVSLAGVVHAAHAAERIGAVAADDAHLRPPLAAPPPRRRRRSSSVAVRHRRVAPTAPVLRVTPAGRSLLTVSPLSSRPVVML